MYLKALEIQGFKSFPDKTAITINKGITAVVGPNGSGKSNISDAIRWVMGETSARQLRGGGKMENVIFGGTQQRSAMGYASVRLYVDNSDRRIDVEADEVVIGRRYYRSGESEYTINGQNVRLKDIYEMFLDELDNHEYGYTRDTEDTLYALGYTADEVLGNPRLKRGIEKAVTEICGRD